MFSTSRPIGKKSAFQRKNPVGEEDRCSGCEIEGLQSEDGVYINEAVLKTFFHPGHHNVLCIYACNGSVWLDGEEIRASGVREWSGQLADSGSTFEKALTLVGAKPAHCFTKGSGAVRWMLKVFTFAPLPSGRKAKEDEKQKEMKGLPESGGAGD
jgi:hypothetical protein